MSDRRQCVSINGALSKFLPVSSGVPQGSVLGPLLYTLFVNELPAVLDNSSEAKKAEHICCFADDTTLTCQNSDHSQLSSQLTESYTKVSTYMVNNGLKLNDDKSHLVVMASNSTKRSKSANLVQIRTKTEIIKPTSNEKLLGCYIQEDLKWDFYIRESDENLMKSLNSRVNALTQLSKIADFKTRKSIGDGIFLSKLSYLITLWSGCSKELLNSLQVIQNKAARAITKNWDIGTSENLKQLGWLSVYQLGFYNTLLTLHQVKYQRKPEYLASIFEWDYIYRTRQVNSGYVKPKGVPKYDVSKRGFRWRAPEHFNRLPIEIINTEDKATFKRSVKIWITENVPIRVQ